MASRPDPEALDTFEAELRKIPGVVAVGYSGGGEDLSVHLVVPSASDLATVRGHAEGLVRLYLDQPVSFVIGPTPGPSRAGPDLRGSGEALPSVAAADPRLVSSLPSRAPRVRLLAVRTTSDDVEVRLGYGDEEVSGREKAGPPGAPAVATLGALRLLGWPLRFSVRSAVRLAFGVEGAVVVVLSGADGERLGIARADVAEEAIVKATLHALNRTLALSAPVS